MPKMYATLGYDLKPTTTEGDGKVYCRNAERIIRKEYYQSGEDGEWPKDPETGENLPMVTCKDSPKWYSKFVYFFNTFLTPKPK